jgi:hypothetical protein
MDLEQKKQFLQQGSALYERMIQLANHDVIRRYLAFRIIVNAMSFEDVVKKRQDQRMREIRNLLLAHKQESEFFEGYKAADQITGQSIATLMHFMTSETSAIAPINQLPELSKDAARTKFEALIPQVFALYEQDFLSGPRLINNFLCFTGNSVQEISEGDLPGAFYRYHSSKALFDLSQYIFNNAYQEHDLIWLTRHSKLDMLLHAQNMADSAIKDKLNAFSIDGILEVLIAQNIGDPLPLQQISNDTKYKTTYKKVRDIRNKLVAHLDMQAPLNDLLASLDGFPVEDIHALVNMTDKSICDVAESHMAIRARYVSGNQPLHNAVQNVEGFKVRPY